MHNTFPLLQVVNLKTIYSKALKHIYLFLGPLDPEQPAKYAVRIF